jgi:hypothetical protein
MAEVAPKVESAPNEKEIGHVTRPPAGRAGVTDTGFEPEVLAFCCEH